MIRIAILDDYQNEALKFADWSGVAAQAGITVFNTPLVQSALIDSLQDFDVLCIMRERTPLNRDILSRLPKLKLIVSTGKRNASLDVHGQVGKGISAQASQGTVREALTSYGSYYTIKRA